MNSTLTPLQSELAARFFAIEQRFVLTGGGALAGFLLGHRETKDLDLFTRDRILDEGARALREAAEALGARVLARQISPTFHRYLVQRGEEGLVVDLAVDFAERGSAPLRFGSIRVDSPEEILANKLCTLLGRAELRDLVDVRALELAGHRLEDALSLAQRKDGGLTAAQLAWVLSQIEIGDDARIPGGVSVALLRKFLLDLQRRLGALSLPAS